MSSQMTKYPPLTQDDIIALRGQPVIKKVDSFAGQSTRLTEEWTYYIPQTNAKESYVFKNGRLAGYKTNPA